MLRELVVAECVVVGFRAVVELVVVLVLVDVLAIVEIVIVRPEFCIVLLDCDIEEIDRLVLKSYLDPFLSKAKGSTGLPDDLYWSGNEYRDLSIECSPLLYI